MSDRPFDEFQHSILKKCIEIAKIETNQAFHTAKQKEIALVNSVPREWRKQLLDYCYDKLRSARHHQKTKLNRKLKTLIENSGWNKDANPEFVVNLSNKQLDKDTAAALGYGLGFAHNKEVDNVDIAKAFCNLEKYSDLSSEEVNICKGLVYASISKPSVPNCPIVDLCCFGGLVVLSPLCGVATFLYRYLSYHAEELNELFLLL